MVLYWTALHCIVFLSFPFRLFPQGRYARRADGVRAVPGGLGHSPGQQLQHHRHPLWWPRQRLPRHQLPPQSQEETGKTRGAGPAGGTQVSLLLHLQAWQSPRPQNTFNSFSFIFRFISKEPYIDKTRMGVYGKVRTHAQRASWDEL